MKKLIDELEKERDNLKESFEWSKADGLNTAISIVRAHNPWHEVGELPERAVNADGMELNFTDDVLVKGANKGELCEAFFRYALNDWCIRIEKHTVRELHFIPTHWAYLPEVQP